MLCIPQWNWAVLQRFHSFLFYFYSGKRELYCVSTNLSLVHHSETNRRQKWGAPINPCLNDSSMELRPPVINSLVPTGAQDTFTKHPGPTVSGFSARKHSVSVLLSFLSDVSSAASVLIELRCHTNCTSWEISGSASGPIVCPGGQPFSDSMFCYTRMSVTQHNFPQHYVVSENASPQALWPCSWL